MSAALRLTEELISRASVTPADGGCQAVIADRLRAAGFECHSLMSGPDNFRVTNLWAIKRGTAAQPKLLAFAGHTDVVPTGPLEQPRATPIIRSARRRAIRMPNSSKHK